MKTLLADNHCFKTTEWTVVLTASERGEPGSFEALQRLCESYWYPVFAYLRRRGKSEEEAKDLVQGFFTHLIQRGMNLRRREDGGRFRTFLLCSLQNFVINEWKRDQRQRRGGGVEILSLTQGDPEARYELDLETDLTPERLFERKWAKAFFGRITRILENEYRLVGKSDRFRVLLPWITEGKAAEGYGVAARALGIKEGAARGAVHRLRARFREIFEAETRLLVDNPADVADEIQYILKLLRE